MGSKFSKRKKKTVKSKNTPRNADSTQSLNTPGHGSVFTNPDLCSLNTGSTHSLSIYVYGNVSPNPDPKAYSQPKDMHMPTLSRTQNVDAAPIVVECRFNTQQAQTIAVPVQKENNERVPGSQQKPNAGPYYCHYEAINEDNLSFRKGDIMQLTNDECLFRLNKKEAEEKLLKPEIKIGTYLLRRSEDTEAYVLSLRCQSEIYEADVMHYKIRVDDKGVCCIDADSTKKSVSNIMDLIKYYTENPGLRCKLKTPLPRDVPLDDLAVKFSDLQLGEKLGSGNFGFVYTGVLHGNKQVAVKSMKAGGSMTVEEFRKEAETMHKLRHPNLVSLLAICEDDDMIHIITERMSKGALLTLLRDDTEHTIKFKDLMEMAIQVVEGMCYLEKKGFVHRDLRAANVLVGDENIAKIADFGLARLLDNYYAHENFYEEKKGEVFPYKWTAPEAINKKKFTVKSDVWSFGILLYEIVTYGDEPYAAMNNAEVLELIEGGNRLKRPKKYRCPTTLYDIMLQCWKETSKERPSFEDIKENLVKI